MSNAYPTPSTILVSKKERGLNCYLTLENFVNAYSKSVDVVTVGKMVFLGGSAKISNELFAGYVSHGAFKEYACRNKPIIKCAVGNLEEIVDASIYNLYHNL